MTQSKSRAGSKAENGKPRSRAEQYAAGKALRETCRREAHAAWKAPAERRDAVELVLAAEKGRLPDLLPLRHGRMVRSAFTFYRRAALTMAADLALPARLAIEGRPGEEHEATVTKVEPLAKTRDYQSPVKYFEATLSLARTDPSFMKPGQKVRAVVRLEEAEGVLAVPRGAVFEKDGKRVVYRRAGGSFVPVEITIGRQSVSRVVLDSGLAAGDVIALRDPTARRAVGPAAATGAEAGK